MDGTLCGEEECSRSPLLESGAGASLQNHRAPPGFGCSATFLSKTFVTACFYHLVRPRQKFEDDTNDFTMLHHESHSDVSPECLRDQLLVFTHFTTVTTSI